MALGGYFRYYNKEGRSRKVMVVGDSNANFRLVGHACDVITGRSVTCQSECQN